MTSRLAASRHPTAVTVIVLNHDGREHLSACLAALRSAVGVDWPEGVVVADNGSRDGSAALVAAEFPGVGWLAFDRNLGFAAGNNRAAETVGGEWLLFLNNDTAVTPGFLLALWAAICEGAICAGARLVTWDGRRLDFDGGGASFTGHGHALGFGRPLPGGDAEPRPSFFASGAAILVHRSTFLEMGGFDPDYFAYYEDLDLGWRLWLAGHDVVHVPTALVRHRHHGTARAVGHQAARLYERNALATVVKNYGETNLRLVLPATLALAAVRAGGPLELIDFAVAAAGSWPPLPDLDWAGWANLEPLKLDWPALWAARERVQAMRCRADAEVLPHLAEPYLPVPATPRMAQATARAVQLFGLREIAGLDRAAESATSAGDRLRRLAMGARSGGLRGLRREVDAYLIWRRSQGQ